MGFRNHKYFMLLIFYTAVDCNIITWTMLDSVRGAISPATSFSRLFSLLFGESLAAFLAMLSTGFLPFHIWLMLRAMTTIEFCEKSMKKSNYDSSVFSRGVHDNICAVLGDQPLLWLFPLSPPSGNGLDFGKSESLMPAKASTFPGVACQMWALSGTSSGGTGSAPDDDDPFLQKTSSQPVGAGHRRFAGTEPTVAMDAGTAAAVAVGGAAGRT